MQFQQGLGDLWAEIKENPDVTKSLLVDGGPLDYVTFRTFYSVEWSECGSNKRAAEEDTMFSWELFLQHCDGSRYLFKSC